MVFNSIEFLLFCILFFSGWPLVRKCKRSKWVYITFWSLFFYGWWDWRFVFLLIGSGLVDYFTGYYMVKIPSRKKLLLSLSLIGNLGALSIFKYSRFFATVIEDLLGLLHLQIDIVNTIPEFTLILPIGISFYTFQSLSYTIDIYRGRLKPTKNIFHFFSYLACFPQLVAGPIVRAKDLLHQLNRNVIPDPLQKWHAVKLVSYGLFQKTVLADNLSRLVDLGFSEQSPFDGTLFYWVTCVAFAFQIYFDFSGYSLIAKGLAKYMGLRFKMNFNHPYLATSLKGFWSRWHISLSTWFRDYVYIPLGGSRKGAWRMATALLATMLLSGLWYGAQYTFLVWAAIHGVLLLAEKITRWNTRYAIPIPVKRCVVLFQVLIAWVYFRSDDMAQANEIVFQLIYPSPTDLSFISHFGPSVFFLMLSIGMEVFIALRPHLLKVVRRSHLPAMDMYTVGGSIASIILFHGEGGQFIYFQF